VSLCRSEQVRGWGAVLCCALHTNTKRQRSPVPHQPHDLILSNTALLTHTLPLHSEQIFNFAIITSIPSWGEYTL
jgi:hypothetical protein